MEIWDILCCQERHMGIQKAVDEGESDAAVLSAGHRAVVNAPVELFDQYTDFEYPHRPTPWAQSCADLILWEFAEQHDFPPAGAVPDEKRFWRLPFAHTNAQMMHIQENPADWKVGYHGAHLYALYSILYHGRLTPSLETAGVEGDRGS